MTLKPWTEIAVPHEDVMRGTFQQAEFAADLSRVHEKTAVPEYQNPARNRRDVFLPFSAHQHNAGGEGIGAISN